ncbi:hypothetical protein ACFLXQ_07425 [Chloroflexota bacterium]
MTNKDDMQKLISEYNRHLQKLKEKEAKLGVHTPPHILIEIENIEAKLEKLRLELADLETLDETNPSPATAFTETSQNTGLLNNPLSCRNILAGIIVTVIGGIILYLIISLPTIIPSLSINTDTSKSVRVEAFHVWIDGDLKRISSGETITTNLNKVLIIEPLLSESNSDLDFDWKSCQNKDDITVLGTHPSKVSYITSVKGIDCVRLFIKKGDRQLAEDSFSVDIK